MSKQISGSNADFAGGGAALGRTRDFMKTPNRFLDCQFKPAPKTDETWGKGESTPADAITAPDGKDKSLKAIVPKT